MIFNLAVAVFIIASDALCSLLLAAGCPGVWVPDLGVIAMVCAALRRGPAAGILAAVVFGLSRHSLGDGMIWTTIVSTAALYGLGKFRHLFFVHSPLTPVLAPAVFYLVIWTLQFSLGIYEDDRSRWVLWWLGVRGSALWATVFAGPLIFGLLSSWDRGQAEETHRDAWLQDARARR